MRLFVLMTLGLAALAGCDEAQPGRAADGSRMLFEPPRTVAASPSLYVIMVRGNLYRVEPGEVRQGWRVSAGTEPTFVNVSAPDEAGAADAVLHMAREIGVSCDAARALVVVRLGAADVVGPRDGSQAWRMSPDCS